jgi:hypothetical protein
VRPFKRVVYERPTHGGTTAIAFRIRVPAEARLRFDYGLDPDRWVSFRRAAITFSVAIALRGGPERVLFSETVDPQRQPAQRQWRHGDVDLEGFAHRAVVLSFRTAADAPSGEQSELAGWAGLRLVRVGAEQDGPE